MDTPAVPFCHLTFLVDRPVERRFERIRVPRGTLGDQLRQRRWQARLKQSDVAKLFLVTRETYRNWEMNRNAPSGQHIVVVNTWLGS
jgi:DNA-binding transcriptional regulator YiaG